MLCQLHLQHRRRLHELNDRGNIATVAEANVANDTLCRFHEFRVWLDASRGAIPRLSLLRDVFAERFANHHALCQEGLPPTFAARC